MQKTILVVEDDDSLRNFLKKVLVSNNFKVVEASDGALALEMVEKHLPDLILLDFGLPKVSGETVCVKVKKDHPEIIIIALTEKTRSSDVVHGLQIGADDYISKPFVAEELIARIDTRFKTIEKESIDPKTAEAEVVEELELNKILLRESMILVITRLIFTEVLFVFSLFLLGILASYLNSYSNIIDLSALYFIILMSVFLINAAIVVFIFLKWSSEYTEVSRGGVSKHTGILHKKEQKYSCDFVETVTLEESLLGRILNYGTIELYDPTLKERIYLLNIANPKKISAIIQKIVLKEKNKPMPIVV